MIAKYEFLEKCGNGDARTHTYTMSEKRSIVKEFLRREYLLVDWVFSNKLFKLI